MSAEESAGGNQRYDTSHGLELVQYLAGGRHSFWIGINGGGGRGSCRKKRKTSGKMSFHPTATLALVVLVLSVTAM